MISMKQMYKTLKADSVKETRGRKKLSKKQQILNENNSH